MVSQPRGMAVKPGKRSVREEGRLPSGGRGVGGGPPYHLVGEVGGPQEWGSGIQGQVHRNGLHQLGEPPLGAERLDETAVGEGGLDLRGGAAAHEAPPPPPFGARVPPPGPHRWRQTSPGPSGTAGPAPPAPAPRPPPSDPLAPA